MTNERRQENELAILYVVLRRLIMKADETKAFKLGLINKKYKIIKDPTNEEERLALSPLNIFIFRIKKSLGTRLISIFRFMYLKNFNESEVLDKLVIKGTINSRTEIKAIKRDINNQTYKSLK
jgi:hypothetical protein